MTTEAKDKDTTAAEESDALLHEPIIIGSDEKLYTVLHGYGKLAATKIHWIDNTKFVGGVAHDVPESVVKAWRTKQPKLKIIILSADATEADYARAAGFESQAPAKTAAILKSTDVDDLIRALGIKDAEALAQEILTHATAQKRARR